MLEGKRHRVRLSWSYGRNWLRLSHLRKVAHRSGRELRVISLVEHFGDIVACEPVVRYARERYPQAMILWCLRSPYRELVQFHPQLDGVIAVQCLTEWMWLRDSRLLDGYYDLHIQGRDCPTCGQPLHKEGGDSRITLDNYYHFGSLLESFCLNSGLPALNSGPQLHIPLVTSARVDTLQLPGSYVAIHGRSNEVERDWETGKWTELVCWLTGVLRLPVVEVGLKPVIERAIPDYRSLCGNLSFLETAEVLRRARLFVGIDSGPAHLANAVNTPGVILLGRYRAFRRYCPYTGQFAEAGATVIQHDAPVRGIAVDEVKLAVNGRLVAAPLLDRQSPQVQTHKPLVSERVSLLK